MQQPWYSVKDFFTALAALSGTYLELEDRKTCDRGRTIRQLLWSLASPSQTQWLMNNLRGLSLHPKEHRDILSLGVTANEALNFQLNSTYRNTAKMLYYATVMIRLRFFEMTRLHAHCTSFYSPTTQQRRSVEVRNIVSSATDIVPISPTCFADYKRMVSLGLPALTRMLEQKKSYTLHKKARAAELKQKRDRVNARAMKKPAAIEMFELKKPTAKRFKRTAFTLKRCSIGFTASS